MMPGNMLCEEQLGSHRKTKTPRVSLACVTCRTRHVRCDAKRPQCSRCIEDCRECLYKKSRRGPTSRTITAARRDLGTVEWYSPRPQPNIPSSHHELGYRHESLRHGLSSNDCNVSEVERSQPLTITPPGSLPDASSCVIATDAMVDAYYRYFHKSHPCVLPRRHLDRLHRDTTKSVSLQPLISVMRFIGALYVKGENTSHWKSLIKGSESDASQKTPGPFMVQFHLLYSIALFWCNDEAQACAELDAAIQIAQDLGMFRRQFAAENARDDPVLAESWRRTWWQLFVANTLFASIKKKPVGFTFDIDATTDLPCEESDYETGIIPPSKTLEEFNFREFSTSAHVYSSFGYLIGVTQDIATGLASLPADPTQESYLTFINEIDSRIDAWLLLLPESKMQAIYATGEIDELMFQAHLALHTTVVGVHRPFSDLWIDPQEDISSCTTIQPTHLIKRVPPTIHTIRCLRSIEAQMQLLALPSRSFYHSPFIVCMISTAAVPLLSACRYHFTGKKLAAARGQIRLSIGCLKALAAVWPRGIKNMQEVQSIARRVLGREEKRASQVERPAPDVDCSVRNIDWDCDFSEGIDFQAASLSTLDCLQAWWDVDSLVPLPL